MKRVMLGTAVLAALVLCSGAWALERASGEVTPAPQLLDTIPEGWYEECVPQDKVGCCNQAPGACTKALGISRREVNVPYVWDSGQCTYYPEGPPYSLVPPPCNPLTLRCCHIFTYDGPLLGPANCDDDVYMEWYWSRAGRDGDPFLPGDGYPGLL